MTNQEIVDPARLDFEKTRRRVEDALQKSITPELLVGVAGKLGVEVALLPEPPQICDGIQDPNRPNFGSDQVRCISQIIPGLSYLERYSNGAKAKIRVLSMPYYQQISGIVVKVERDDNPYNPYAIGLVALSNYSIFPKSGGEWSDNPWLAFIDESKPVGLVCCHLHCGSPR